MGERCVLAIFFSESFLTAMAEGLIALLIQSVMTLIV